MREPEILPLASLPNMNGLNISFVEVIRQIEGKEVIKFENPELLQILETVCTNIIAPVNASGYTGRINEFGNHVEPFFITGCRQLNLECNKPVNTNGYVTNSGYPDCLLTYNNEHYYIEIKTYTDSNKKTSLRSFYYSPLKTSKITLDACHLLIGFVTIKRNNGYALSGSFSVVDLFNIGLTLKTEFNTNNKSFIKLS
jgi:hypothetical protein